MALGRGLSFNEFNPRHSARMQGGAGAAENASVAENFSALRGAAPDYGSMGRNAIAAAGLEERAVRDANTAVRRSKIQNEASIYSAEQIAKAKTEAARSQANSSMMGSLYSRSIRSFMLSILGGCLIRSLQHYGDDVRFQVLSRQSAQLLDLPYHQQLLQQLVA